MGTTILHPATTPAPSARRPSPRHRGFTLTETIAAVIVLSIGIPPMLWTIRESHAHRANPRLFSHARWLATQKLEDVIADRHSATRGYAYLIPANYPSEASIPGYPGYGRAVTLTETGADLATPGSGYITVEVTVSFADAKGMPRSLAISTVLTEYAP